MYIRYWKNKVTHKWRFHFRYRVCRTFATLQIKNDADSVSAQLLSQNAFGYVLPITSFVVAWLETWFLDFKVLTQEADEERGECSDPEELEYDELE